jgi:hypothetical protein
MRRLSLLLDKLSYLTLSAVNFKDRIIQRPVLKDYAETGNTVTVVANVLTLDLETGNHFVVTLNANVTTLTISNPPASGKWGAFTVEFVMDGTPRTVAWGASVHWPGALAPTLTSDLNCADVFMLRTRNGGSSWYGFVLGQDIAI